VIKFNAGYSTVREAHIFVVGLTNDDFTRMIVHGKAEVTKSEDMDFPSPGFSTLIVGAKDEAAVKRKLTEMLNVHFPSEEDAKVTVLKFPLPLFVLGFSDPKGRQGYIFAFTDESAAALRNGQSHYFRVRSTDKSTIPIEIVFFWVTSEASVQEELAKAGLTGPHTKGDK
jgi:hypothetical protein